MKVQKVYVSQYEYCWIVLDNDYEPVEPIVSFIKFLRNVDKSPCTIKGYAHSLIPGSNPGHSIKLFSSVQS